MSRSARTGRVVGVVVVVAVAAVAVGLAVTRIRRMRDETNAAVDDIEDRLAGLDPVTRASVVAKLSSDEINRVRTATRHGS